MVHFIVPARAGSKRFPNKSRLLVPLMKDRFPKKVKNRIIITTDDPVLHDEFKDSLFRVRRRSATLARDDTPIKPVLQDVIDYYDIYPNDDICLMYPTYPERNYGNTRDVLADYQRSGCNSMLCCHDYTQNTWTYTMIDRDPETRKAEILLDQDKGVYRRQDSFGQVCDIPNFDPKSTYFEYSHFTCVFKANHLQYLNDNLYNEDTVYYKLNRKMVDVDTEDDWNEYLKNKNDE